jgi:hypothetical protein
MVLLYIFTEKSACQVLHTVTEWEFPSCGTWKVRRNGWWRRFDVDSNMVRYSRVKLCVVGAKRRVRHGRHVISILC